MNSTVQQIKDRLSIEELVSSYLKLEKAGANLKAKCPFHNEKTPSFFISPGRGGYYCFGCGAKGDIFTFVQEFEGLDFKGALKLLADRTGVQLEKFNREQESEKEKLYRIVEEATKFFENNLTEAKEVQAYLKGRGVEEKTIKNFRIGFAKNDWRELYFYLQKKGFSDQEMEKAGLAKASEKGFYDKFRNRIMFPISDSIGRVIAFSGRHFGSEDEKAPKYLNSPDTPIFSKSSVLYGLDKAKDSIRKNNFSILVEGQFDLVLSHQAGFRNTIATSGTALSDSTVSRENAVSNLGLVRRISSNIVLAFDADKAGVSAANRAAKIALSLGMDVKVASLPEGIDPADQISKNGIEAWKESVRNSKHIIEFLLARILKNTNGEMRKAGREIKEKILPFVADVESAIEQAHFIKKIHETTQIPEEALNEDLKKVSEQAKLEKSEVKQVEKAESALFRKDYIERRLLGIIFWQQGLKESSLNLEDLMKEISEILEISPEEILKRTEDLKEDLIFEAEVFYQDEINLKKDVTELLNNLKEENLKEKLMQKMKILQDFEEKKDSKKVSEVLKEIHEINNKIQEIKNSRK